MSRFNSKKKKRVEDLYDHMYNIPYFHSNCCFVINKMVSQVFHRYEEKKYNLRILMRIILMRIVLIINCSSFHKGTRNTTCIHALTIELICTHFYWTILREMPYYNKVKQDAEDSEVLTILIH